MTPEEPNSSCPIVETIKTLGGKWNMITIRYLLVGPKKFNQLKRDIGDVSSKTLSRCLKHLMQEGLVERQVNDTSPVSVEYYLTDKGRELNEALQSMAKWGDKWLLGRTVQTQKQQVVMKTKPSSLR